MLHLFKHGQIDIQNPTFKLLERLSGIDNLDPALTINGTTVYPTLRYKGGDADGTNWIPWTYGETLTLQAGTAPTYNNGSPLLGTNDDSVLFNAGGYYKAGNNTFADVDLEDMVVECVFKMSANQPVGICAHRGGAVPGWRFLTTTSTRVACSIGSGARQISAGLTLAGTLVANSLYHIIIFIDRSGSSVSYVNGAVQGTQDISSLVAASLSTADIFTIGSIALGSSPYDSNIAYLAMWKRDNWLDTHLQATIAAERFYRLTGTWPQKAAGTAAPVVATRASVAMIDKLESGVRYLYKIGINWMRMCYRNDSNGTNIKGFLAETQETNYLLQSEDLSTTWSLIDAGDVIGGSVTAPDKTTNTKAGIIGDSTDGDHGVTQTTAALTAAVWSFSCFAKAGNKSWLYLSDDTVANCTCYFNLSSPAVGTAGAGAVGYIEDWGNGWCRCCIIFTGTVAAHTFKIQPADADSDKTVTGDGATVNIYAWGAQVEIASHGYMTSYYPTTIATATRQADVLYFAASDGNIGGVGSDEQGTISANILMNNYNNLSSKSVITLSDGGAASDYIQTYINASDALASIVVDESSTQANISDAGTDIANNVIHKCKTLWDVNNTKQYVDAVVEDTPDTTCTMPDELDRINIGSSNAGTLQLNGVISDIKIYSKPTTK